MPIGINERNYSASIETEVYSAMLSQINLDNFSNHVKFKLNKDESLIISNCEILKKYENILLAKSVNIQISEEYYYRPEMISLRIYNTTDLWFLILFLNKLESVDKLENPIIKVLDPNQVSVLLEIINNERSKTNFRNSPMSGEDLQLKKLTDKSDFIIKKVFNRYQPVKHPEYVTPTIRKVFSSTLHSNIPNDGVKTIIKKILDNKRICLPISDALSSDRTILKTELLLQGPFPNTIKPLFFGSCTVLYKGIPIFEEENNTDDIISSLKKNLIFNNNQFIINENKIIREDLIAFINFSQQYTGVISVDIKDTSNNITSYNFSINNSSKAFIPIIFNSGIYNDENTGIMSVIIRFSAPPVLNTNKCQYGQYTFKEITLPVSSMTSYEDVIFIYNPILGDSLYKNNYFFNAYLSYNFKKFVPIDSSLYHSLTEENFNIPFYNKKVILTDIGLNDKKSDDISISVDVSINNYETTDCVGIFFKRKKVATNLGRDARSKIVNMEDSYYLYCLSVKDFKTEKLRGSLSGLYKIETASNNTYKITRPGCTLIKVDPDNDFYLVGKKIADTPQYLTGNVHSTNIRLATEGPLITIYDERNKPLIEYRDNSPITEKCVYSNTLEELKRITGTLSYGIFEFTDKTFSESGSAIKISNVVINKLGYEKLGGSN